MIFDYHITGGRVIDPARGVDEVQDVFISGWKIAPPPRGHDFSAKETIDASGYLVLPGLIDFHMHMGYPNEIGLSPDAFALPNGVTSAVDPGASGSANYEFFSRGFAARSLITIKSFLNVSSTGIITEKFRENLDPANFDESAIERLVERYPDDILGIKVRIGRKFSGAWGVAPLDATLRIARRVKRAAYVHCTDPDVGYDKIMPHFAAGDFLCHCFQGDGKNTIIGDDGRVLTSVQEARKRGVIFDYAGGRGNHNLKITRRALDDGFMPDILSTDLLSFNAYKRPLFSLLYVMSEFLALGVPLADIVRAVTATPGKIMNCSPAIGTLAPGAAADVAIVEVRPKEVEYYDIRSDERVTGDAILVPALTIKGGYMAYCQLDFCLDKRRQGKT
jgi:dihydroorotase